MAVAAGDGSVSESTMTQMQELASAWVFKRAIEDNQTWRNWEELKEDKDRQGKTFEEIKNIWDKVGNVTWVDDVDDQWLQSFYKQQEALLGPNGIGQPKFTTFVRSKDYISPGGKKSKETFMEWVSELVNERFQIDNKDNWNPADIWLIQDETKWKDKIKAAMKDKRRSSTTESIEAQLAEFNAIFRALYRTRQIVGISLKKVSGETATYKHVNASEGFFTKLESIKMTQGDTKCSLGTQTINIKKDKKTGEWKIDQRKAAKKRGKTGFQTVDSQDTSIKVEDDGLITGEKETYRFQIKANDSTKKAGSNLKFEPTAKGAAAARMGKATRELVFDLMKSPKYNIYQYWKPYKYGSPNTDPTKYQHYPITVQQFTGLDRGYDRNYNMKGPWKEYFDMLTHIKVNGVNIGTNNPFNAILNLKETFENYSQPWVANNKCMQISWLYAFYQLDQEKRNDFCTDLLFLAAKEGKRYGPFGKIF